MAVTDGRHDIMLFSDAGKAVRFDEQDVRPMGREAHGVRGMTLAPGQQVISLVVADDESKTVLVATENGFGKRTPVAEFTRHGRGTQGMIAIQTTARNGKVVAARLVTPEDEVMLITTGGVLIRTRVAEIREMGRATQGVTLINLGDDEKLAGLERVVETDENGSEDAAVGFAWSCRLPTTVRISRNRLRSAMIDRGHAHIQFQRRSRRCCPKKSCGRRRTRCSTGTAAACRSWR